MHIAIVGAGFSGLVTASTLLAFGHSIVIFDTAPDVGGVWSRSKRYPGLRTQNPRDTYALSSMRMSASYPLHPKGEHVQAYLEEYARLNGLHCEGRLRLGTEVVNAERKDYGWVIHTRSTGGEQQITRFDHLVVASGVYNVPHIPELKGLDSFLASGGRIVHTSQLRTLDEVAGKRVVVLGYGKSACDAAVEVARCAHTTTLVAKDFFWKLPTYIGGVLHYSYLLLTRVGETLFPWIRPWRTQRIMDTIGSPLRRFLFSSLGAITSIQLGLGRLSMVPDTPFETIARSTISLATPGLYQAISNGEIAVRRGMLLSVSPGSVSLSDATTLPADVIVCGTGWRHDLPSFLPADLIPLLTDSSGNWTLYRHILPVKLPNLSFIGFASSLFCPLTAEISALWLAAYLTGGLLAPFPSEEEQGRRQAEDEARWLGERTNGCHAKGTSIVPFSMSFVDELLEDLGVGIGWWDYLREWVLPVDPAAYKGLRLQVLERQASRASGRRYDKVWL